MHGNLIELTPTPTAITADDILIALEAVEAVPRDKAMYMNWGSD